MVSDISYQVRVYSVKHSYDVLGFLESYRLMLHRAIDEICASMRWVEKSNDEGRGRLVPVIPREGMFKHHCLRSFLMEGWRYSKHYFDSTMKQAYSIIKPWRRSYLKGERSRRKPTVKRRFVRVKGSLYSFRIGIIKMIVKPTRIILSMMFRGRGSSQKCLRTLRWGLILNEKHLTITFRFKAKGRESYESGIAWDCSERSLDGFNPKLGWIRVDLSQLFHIHRVYELNGERLQSIASGKPSSRKVLAKYSRRERNRVSDSLHKVATFLSKQFKSYLHGFENFQKKNVHILEKT